MVILGIGLVDHEASVALVKDGVLLNAIARERLTRIRKDGKMWGSARLDPTLGVRYCLEQHGLSPKDVDLVVWGHIDHVAPAEFFATLAKEGALDLSDRPRLVLSHHFAHACAAYYTSGFEDAVVMIADGSGGPLDGLRANSEGPERDALERGEVIVQNLRDDQAPHAREQESFYACEGGRWRPLRKIAGDFGGIGAEYGSASEYLFGECLHAGKTMGLAPYGHPRERDYFMRRVGTDELAAFRTWHPPERDAWEERIAAFKKAQGKDVAFTDPLVADFAACIQVETERALLTHARWLKKVTGANNLCLAGGVALNCVANSLLAREAGFEQVFVPSAPGDDGIALGCALYGAAAKGELRPQRYSPYLGRTYPHRAEDIGALGVDPVPLGGRSYREVVAQKLADGAVVAFFQGRAELGPRALGNRSFLADPRRAEMTDHLNKVVKQREPFRPFAPVVLEEAVLDFFVQHHPSRFMSFVAEVREDKRAVVPAITHVDGTARYQVLAAQDNPELHALLREFGKLTGVPLLLNTSLNRAGEPIVETPAEAARCAVASSADYLVLDGALYRCRSSRL